MSNARSSPVKWFAFFLSSIVLLMFIAVISVVPIRAYGDCVELQTYPPQVVCSGSGGSSGGGIVGTSNNGVGIGAGGSSSQDSSFGPVAFWKFDEADGSTTLDSSGNGNNGMLENGAARYVGTQQGNKLLLDGVDDRVTVSPVSANASSMSAFTIMTWVQPTVNGGIILRKGNTSTARFNFGMNSQGQLYLRTGYSGQSGAWTTTSTLPLNTWSHVAVTYSFGTTSDPVFYIGGTQAQSTEIQVPMGDIVADTPFIYIGNNHDLVNRAQEGFTSGFSGRMDNVRIYNIALSPAAVASAITPEPDASLYVPMLLGTIGGSSGGGNAEIISSLMAQVRALQAQIAAIQGTTHTAATTANNACPVLARNLMRGSRGEDVRKLQQFLTAQGQLVAGNDTGYFGARTEAAVILWQSAHRLDPIGIGGPRTRAAIAASCS